MNTISQFATNDPKQLSTQLSNLEQNIVKETANIRSTYELAKVATDDDPVSPIKTYTTGQCARIDSTHGAVTLRLSAPADGLPGEILVVQAVGGNGFVAVGIGATINNAATRTFASAFVTRFYFDGKNFWS
jgi:hypothetical protein